MVSRLSSQSKRASRYSILFERSCAGSNSTYRICGPWLMQTIAHIVYESVVTSPDEYLKQFDSQVTVLETFGVELPKHLLLVKLKPIKAVVLDTKNVSDPEQKRAEKAVVEE